MSKFSLKRIEQVNGRNPFYKLIKDDKCEFDNFCSECEKDGYESELRTLYTIMDLCSNQVTLPDTKLKEISKKKDPVKEHEFKTKHLRAYGFQDKGTGKIIVCGGRKTKQQNDINHLRQVKDQYLVDKEKNDKA